MKFSINDLLSIVRLVITENFAETQDQNATDTIEQKAAAFARQKIYLSLNRSAENFDKANSIIQSGNVQRLHVFTKNMWADQLNDQRTFGCSLLYLAACTNHNECVRKLLTIGAQHRIEPHGMAPIHAAAQSGNDKSLKEFIYKGISVITPDNSGQYNALHYAAFNGHKNCVDILLSAGRNIFSIDDLNLALELAKYGNTKKHQQCADAITKRITNSNKKQQKPAISSDQDQIQANSFQSISTKLKINTFREKENKEILLTNNNSVEQTSPKLEQHKNDKPKKSPKIQPKKLEQLLKPKINIAESSSNEPKKPKKKRINTKNIMTQEKWENYALSLMDFSEEAQRIFYEIHDLGYEVYVSGKTMKDLLHAHIHATEKKPIAYYELITNTPSKYLESLTPSKTIKFISMDSDPLNTVRTIANFTIDISYADPINQTIHFPNLTLMHLKSNLLKIIGNPKERFNEKPHLIFQTMLFKYQYNANITPSMTDAINECAYLLQDKTHFNYNNFIKSIEKFFEIGFDKLTNETAAIVDVLSFFKNSNFINHLTLTNANKFFLYGNPSNQGELDVFEAAAQGNIERLQILFKQNIKLNQCNERGETPLTLAVKNNNTKCICFLLLAGTNIKLTLKSLPTAPMHNIPTMQLAF